MEKVSVLITEMSSQVFMEVTIKASDVCAEETPTRLRTKHPLSGTISSLRHLLSASVTPAS